MNTEPQEEAAIENENGNEHDGKEKNDGKRVLRSCHRKQILPLQEMLGESHQTNFFHAGKKTTAHGSVVLLLHSRHRM